LLADFGIAREIGDISGLTATNMVVGTTAYSAPEQLMGSDIDGRADQYGLGCTAFHLLTGVAPYRNSNPAVVISQHLSAPPPQIGERRPKLAELNEVIAGVLAKDPGDRYPSRSDFATALTGHPGVGAAATVAGRVVTAPTTRLTAPQQSTPPKARRFDRCRPRYGAGRQLQALHPAQRPPIGGIRQQFLRTHPIPMGAGHHRANGLSRHRRAFGHRHHQPDLHGFDHRPQ
jgi:serine/threonine protein kinase